MSSRTDRSRIFKLLALWTLTLVAIVASGLFLWATIPTAERGEPVQITWPPAPTEAKVNLVTEIKAYQFEQGLSSGEIKNPKTLYLTSGYRHIYALVLGERQGETVQAELTLLKLGFPRLAYELDMSQSQRQGDRLWIPLIRNNSWLLYICLLAVFTFLGLLGVTIYSMITNETIRPFSALAAVVADIVVIILVLLSFDL